MIAEHQQYQSEIVPIEVLQEVLNVPMAAIVSIGRTEDVLYDCEQSECISIGSLGVYADAYIRKLKSYFRRMTSRHTSGLDPHEESDFNEFCKLYKKSDLTYSQAKKWEDIDTDLLYEDFYALVKEKSPSSFNNPNWLYDPSSHTYRNLSVADDQPQPDETASAHNEFLIPSLFAGLGGMCISQQKFDCYDPADQPHMLYVDLNLIDNIVLIKESHCLETPKNKRRHQLLYKIVRSEVYLIHKSNLSLKSQDIRRAFIRRFFLPFRFHIFSSDDDILPVIAA